MDVLDSYSQLSSLKMIGGIREDYKCEVVPSFIKFCKLKNAINTITLKETEELKIKFANHNCKLGQRFIADYLEVPVSTVTERSNLEYRKQKLRALLTDKEFTSEKIVKSFRALEEENDVVKALNYLLKGKK